MMAGGVSLLGQVIVLGIYSLLGGVFLRAAVAGCNKLVPRPKREDLPEQASVKERNNEAIVVDQRMPEETGNPYATPQTTEILAIPVAAVAIPEPAYGKACGICLTAFVLNVAVILLLRFLFGMQDLAGRERVIMERLFTVLPLAVAFISFPIVFSVMLPTSLVRSALVSAAFGVVTFFAFVIIGGVVAAGVFVFEN